LRLDSAGVIERPAIKQGGKIGWEAQIPWPKANPSKICTIQSYTIGRFLGHIFMVYRNQQLFT